MSELGPALIGWERTALAVEKVRDRLRRASTALDQAGIAYAVIGGNAVAEWVGRVEEAVVRNTRDVDILIRRADSDAVKSAMEAAGFVHQSLLGIDIFLDGPNGRPQDRVHIVFAIEKVRPEHESPAPDVGDSVPAAEFRVIALDSLVKMKLIAFYDKDRTHLRDMISVGLIDQSWRSRLPVLLAERVQQILDTPDG